MIKRLLASPATWIILVLVALALIGGQFFLRIPLWSIIFAGIVLYLVWAFYWSKRQPRNTSPAPHCTTCSCARN